MDKDFKQNKSLSEISDLIDFKNDEFHLIFLCLGRIEGQAKIQSDKELPYEEDLLNRIDIEFLDEGQIGEEYRNVAAIGKESEDVPGTFYSAPLQNKSERTPIIKLETDNWNSYVFITEANQLVQHYRKKSVRDNLFSLNIRNYLGNNKNNQGIIRTAKESSEKFFSFNNGISCLAKTVNYDTASPSKIDVIGLQVINGAQTVKALVKAAKDFGATPPLVLMRITELSKGYGQSGNLREDIIKYNNTQTTIKSSDFRSNDPVQEDLRKKFSTLSKDGKRVFYINKRTDPALGKNVKKIKMEDFAKVVYSFLGDYTDFDGNTNFLFDIEKNGYKTIFGDGEDIYPREMPQEAFEIRAAIWWIGEAFDQLRKKIRLTLKEEDKASWNALERKYTLIYVAKKILEASERDKWSEWVRKGYKGIWSTEEEGYGMEVRKLFEAAKTVVTLRYKEDSKNINFVHRDWFRRNETRDNLINFSKAMGPTLFKLHA